MLRMAVKDFGVGVSVGPRLWSLGVREPRDYMQEMMHGEKTARLSHVSLEAAKVPIVRQHAQVSESNHSQNTSRDN